LWTIIGSLISLISIAYAGYIVIETLFFGNDAKGWPTLVVAVSFLGGVQLLSIGILGEYIGRSGISSAYGAAASLIVVLLWVYYSAQIFLFGAEFTWVYAHRFGSRRGQPKPP
jgi:membrane protein